MIKNSYKRTSCRLCHSKKLTQVLELTPIPLPDDYLKASEVDIKQPVFPLNLVLCRRCGNVQLSDVVNPKIIYRNYIYETVSSMGLTEHFQRYAAETISRLQLLDDSLVLDIGSNDGTLLKAFKKLGMRVLGIDPAVEIAKAATLQGIDTLPEFFSTPELVAKITKKYGKPRIITVNNLFANIDDLDAFMVGIKKLLADDGVLVIESYYLPDLIKNMVFDFIYHEHLTSFTAGSLKKFFARLGLQLFDVMHVPTKGGSLRYFIQLKTGKRKITPELKKYLKYENESGVHSPTLYKKFQKQITVAKEKLTKALAQLKKQNKLIAGYGASATSTTLIYHFDLAKYVTFLIDDYSRKQNTFSPGVHIPVFPSGEIAKRKPDAIVILAWRYADPIIAKNRKYVSDGGKFVIPLPKLKIISGMDLNKHL